MGKSKREIREALERCDELVAWEAGIDLSQVAATEVSEFHGGLYTDPAVPDDG